MHHPMLASVTELDMAAAIPCGVATNNAEHADRPDKAMAPLEAGAEQVVALATPKAATKRSGEHKREEHLAAEYLSLLRNTQGLTKRAAFEKMAEGYDNMPVATLRKKVERGKARINEGTITEAEGTKGKEECLLTIGVDGAAVELRAPAGSTMTLT